MNRDNQVGDKRKTITLLSEEYCKDQKKFMGHLLRAYEDDPTRYVTFKANKAEPKLNHTKRSGRPRINWTIKGMEKCWGDTVEALEEMDPNFFDAGFDHMDQAVQK